VDCHDGKVGSTPRCDQHGPQSKMRQRRWGCLVGRTSAHSPRDQRSACPSLSGVGPGFWSDLKRWSIPAHVHRGIVPKSATKGTHAHVQIPSIGRIRTPIAASTPPNATKEVLPFVKTAPKKQIQLPRATSVPRATAYPPTLHRMISDSVTGGIFVASSDRIWGGSNDSRFPSPNV